MPSVNQEIQRRTIGASVDLLRYEAGERRDIRRFLEDLRKKLTLQIADAQIEATTFQQAKLQATLDAANAAIRTTYKDIKAEQTLRLIELARVQQRVAEGIINNVVGVALIDSTFNGQQLKSLLSNMLIEGAPSAEWWARAEKGVRERFADTVRQGMLRGATTGDLVRELKDTLLVKTTREAEAIVRTSVQTAANMIRQDVYRANSDIIGGVEWVSTLDERTTEVCQALDGLQWDLDFNPIDHDQPYPGATAHWGCRSTQVPILKSWEQLAKEAQGNEELAEKLDEIEKSNPSTRASLDGQVPDKLTYEDWLKAQPEALQKDILGPGKWELWGEGKVSLREMIDQSGNPLTLAEIEARAATSAGLLPAVSDRTREVAFELLGQGRKIEEVIAELTRRFPDEKNVRGISLIYRKEWRVRLAEEGKIKLPAPKAPTPKEAAPKFYKSSHKDIPVEGIPGYERGMMERPELVRSVMRIADEMEVPYSSINFVDKAWDFNLNGRTATAAAWAETTSVNGATFYNIRMNAGREFFGPTAAHEFTHIRYERVARAYLAERNALNDAIHRFKIPRDLIFNADNTVKAEVAEHLPFIKRFDKYMQNTAKMQADDGFTSYSKEYWEQFSKGMGSIRSAYHETLAEIAAVDEAVKAKTMYRHFYPTGLAPTPIWREFADAVHASWADTPQLRMGLEAYGQTFSSRNRRKLKEVFARLISGNRP